MSLFKNQIDEMINIANLSNYTLCKNIFNSILQKFGIKSLRYILQKINSNKYSIIECWYDNELYMSNLFSNNIYFIIKKFYFIDRNIFGIINFNDVFWCIMNYEKYLKKSKIISKNNTKDYSKCYSINIIKWFIKIDSNYICNLYFSLISIFYKSMNFFTNKYFLLLFFNNFNWKSNLICKLITIYKLNKMKQITKWI